MSVIKKTSTKIGHNPVTVVPYIKSYADDPYFVKKANEAREIIAKYGLPGEKKNK
ncbi:hypothetical protein [Pedobacter sp. L105]|uniref:hypothetical protein n=1 Tax=Pedobacter sp. L105 TaxID=1641871 RepID=UPI0015760E95|nr:hypothetical protein [Pedobacter sp. L105]